MRRRVVVGAVLGAFFALGWWAGGGRAAHGVYSGLDLFLEVLQTVQANYVDPVDIGRVMNGAMRGVTQRLDPWSRYLDADELRAARGAVDGVFDGVGASVDQRSGWPVVIAPIEGSPAWDAGLEPGDVITEVDGRSTFGLTPDEMGARLRGSTGTFVRFTVARGGEERALELMRRRVTVRNVPYSLLAEPGVGYVRLAQFSNRAGAEVAAACDSLRALGAHALMLDLRGNPGGTLEEAVAVASQFLPSGARVVSTDGRAPSSRQRYMASRPRPELGWPLVVLVDGGTASAAEIVAGALQDHDRAVLVGDTTYGKGVSQQIYPLRTGLGAIQLTVARYLTPSGRSIHREPLSAHEDVADDEAPETGEGLPPSRDSLRSRAFRTALGREVRGGDGLAPDVFVATDPGMAAPRLLGRHPGGKVAAAREALARDPAYRRALEVLRRSSDARGVFAAAGVQLPGTGAPRR
jgi:carboxyl-terminal processing protease